MINRRSLMASAGIAALMGLATGSAKADVTWGKINGLNRIDPNLLSPEYREKHSIRLPKLDDESAENFIIGFRHWMQTELSPVVRMSTEKFLAAQGIAPDKDLGFADSFTTLLGDRLYALQTRLVRTAQSLMWDGVIRPYHREADKYLALLEQSDKTGPGSVELNPDMHIPEYARYEYHTQPGGYVGDPFAGFIYIHGVKAFHDDQNSHEEMQWALAESHPTPSDGKVRRVLDIASGTGQSTTAVKERFPAAEVWGIDVSGPMVRYAHYRAAQLGLDVHFAQRLAEDNKFPDGYFDMVTGHILFHEVPSDQAKKVVAEIHRVLRPGGVWHHMDVGNWKHPRVPPPTTIAEKASVYSDHRYNVEPWTLQYRGSDFPGVLAQAGFTVDMDAPATRWGLYPGLIATKTA